jgi:hypothetical protein
MLKPVKSIPLGVLAFLAVLGGPVLFQQAPASAYFRSNRSMMGNYRQGARGSAFMNYAQGYSPARYGLGRLNQGGFRSYPGYYPSNPYYPSDNSYPSNNDPFGGYLSGAADAIRSQGQFQIDYQKAKLTKEQAEQAKIETRRKSFDEWLYERAHRPTYEDERERLLQEKIRRSRNDPPPGEIWSGKALNDLMVGIRRMQAQGIQGPTVPLDPAMLKQINVSAGATGTGTGSIGLLREGGKLYWPLPLKRSAFEEERRKVDQLTAQAYRQAGSGSVSAGTLEDLTAAVDTLQSELKRNISKVSANDYIKAKRYLNQLESTVKMLDSPNVSKYVTGTWAAKGATVAQLTANMTREGLIFAPATQGDEAAYRALHSALVQYYTPSASVRSWDPMTK